MGIKISINKSHELTKGESKVLEGLKNAYKEISEEVYVYVQSTLSGKRPDFIVIDQKRGISILEVKDWSEDYIVNVNRRKVKLLDLECDNPIMQVKGYKNILSSAAFSRDFENINEEDISTCIIFSNMNKEIKEKEKFKGLFNTSIKYLFKSDISNINISNIFNDYNPNYSEQDLKKVRVALFPELEIVSIENDKVENMDVRALDFEQEEFAKKIPFGNYMVTGIPGSGKTVILLARAVYLIKENPSWKILILTYNKSLSYKLNSKLNKMVENFKNDINNNNTNFENIEIRHFHSEISKLTNGVRKPNNIDDKVWFSEEVVKIASENARPTYDAILIDEYQDFYMNWIELCVKLCKSYTDKNGKIVKNIFLAGDRLQSIYNNREISWKSIGIDMRGRSKFLKTSYRSAKQHMNIAIDFLKNNEKLKSEVNNFYIDESDDNSLNSLNNGSIDFVTGNFSLIGDKILELKNQGYKNEDFLILAGTKKICNNIKNSCIERIRYQMEYVKDLDENEMSDNIVITTYHSSKGLEAKVVFLTTMDSIFNGDDQEGILKRKTIYVGMTRASEKLYIHRKSNDFNNYIQEIHDLYNAIN